MAAELPPTRGPGPPTAYLPIAEHGIIGDLHTAAMVASDGTIDCFSPERFDGPSVFGALLDRERGGFYRIAPADPLARTKQLYLPDTNVCDAAADAPSYPKARSKKGHHGAHTDLTRGRR